MTRDFFFQDSITVCIVQKQRSENELRMRMRKVAGEGQLDKHFKSAERDFIGGPDAKTLCCQCKGPGFHPWSEN